MSRKALTLSVILQGLKNMLGKLAVAINTTRGHSIRVLNKKSISDGGNLCPLCWVNDSQISLI